METKEKAIKYLAENQSVKSVYATSDGFLFLEKIDAQNHADTLEDKKVQTFEKSLLTSEGGTEDTDKVDNPDVTNGGTEDTDKVDNPDVTNGGTEDTDKVDNPDTTNGGTEDTDKVDNPDVTEDKKNNKNSKTKK